MATQAKSNRRCSLGQFSGGSALLDAITKGKIHLARFILDAVDANLVNTKDFQGKTPLIRTVYIKETKSRLKAVELLLSKGAEVNAQDDRGRTVLMYAVEHGANDVLRMLVKNNIDPDIADTDGNTALIHAAITANDEAIEMLLKSFRRLGLVVDHENADGMTALLVAAKSGHVECATLLAQEGKASVSKRDRHRMMNAEEWAREKGCSTPELLPFSACPNKARIRNGKFYARSGAARLDLDLAEMYGHSMDDSTIVAQDDDGAAGDSMRPRARTLPKQMSLPSTSALTEAIEEGDEKTLYFAYKRQTIAEEVGGGTSPTTTEKSVDTCSHIHVSVDCSHHQHDFCCFNSSSSSSSNDS